MSIALLLCVLSEPATALPAPEILSPVSPEDSLKHFELPKDLRIELVACEPDVIDPVAIRFDEDGRMWVVEMRDYPQPLSGEGPRSRISILTDQDGDGRFERAQVFADELLFATGLQPWQGGAIVTVSGEVIYLKDTDGDGRADQRELWFKGFAAENSQLRANHPRFALDNSIYVANGLRGGSVIDVRYESKPLSISSRDFRFDPRSNMMKAVSGVGQFGLTFDNFGNRFVCSNRNPLRHIVLEDRYLELNPAVPIPETAHDVAAFGEASKVFPLVSAWTTSNLHAGQFTAACGVDIYRGDLLPDSYRSNAFTCEPTGSLVHREILQPAGATFTSTSAYDGKEFLASRDAWFRPVNLETGPDGALYVVDMYRAVIEHPDFMPEELKNRPDLRLGNDRGRIYRIAAADKQASASRRPTLSKAPALELVKLLEYPNGWHRETAARLLYERQDRRVAQQLQALAAGGTSAVSRVHALHALAGLGLLDQDLVAKALSDAHPRVQEHAAFLAEPWLSEQSPGAQQLRDKIGQLASSHDSRLRFQAALSLAFTMDAPVGILAAIALSDVNDVWTRRAVLVSSRTSAGEVLATILKSLAEANGSVSSSRIALVKELSESAGSQGQPDQAILSSIATLPESAEGRRLQIVALTGLANGMSRRGTRLPVANNEPAVDRPASAELKETFDAASEIANDSSAALEQRLEAIDLLRFAEGKEHIDVLARLATEGDSEALQTRAIASLSPHGDPQIGPRLLSDFRARTPTVRRAILDAVIGPKARAAQLLDEIAAKRIAVNELDPPRRERLLRHGDAEVRRRASDLLAAAVSPDRQKVIETYKVVLARKTDPHRGKELFRKHCATCHKVGDVGVDVGPDISDSRVKTAEQYLTDILAPNKAIDSNFISYSALMTDGTVHTGVLTTETSGSITLKAAENKVITLLRADIEKLQSNGVSLMPEGFEMAVPPQDMGDLISYIKNWRYLNGEVRIPDPATSQSATSVRD